MRLALLYLFLSVASTHAWSLVEPSNEACKKQWKTITLMKRGEIEAKLLGYGLSSTGKIKIQNIYKLTHDSDLGAKGERIAMFIQEDLMGGRLFWVVLFNLETKEAQLIYDNRNRHKQNKHLRNSSK